jgi:hypothetical protein
VEAFQAQRVQRCPVCLRRRAGPSGHGPPHRNAEPVPGGFDANYAGASVGAAGQWLPVGHLSLSGQISFGGTLSNAHVAFADGTRTSGLALRPTYSGYGGIGYVGYTVQAGLFWSYTNEALGIGSDDVTVKRGTVMLYLGLRL